MPDCRVYWGSHGCIRRRGHRGGHVCHCAPLFARFWLRLVPWSWRRGNVGAPPYYGRDTNFYGEDARAG